jgi:pimeloyl-ACP methyl ester carboxylesterase
MPAARLDALLAQFRPDSLPNARAFIDRIVTRPHWSHAILAWGVRARFEQPGVVDLLRLASTAELLAPAELAGLSMPVLLLWGRRERLFGATERDFFFEHLPAHSVREQPDFGHAPFLDRPRELAQRIHAFARDLAAAPAGGR